ncbi:T9SS type A sorting domain-containing protein [Galbibacter mesophilus]|uniref:T9SS type A sorting domain-containing protein n=1 Tax=Galbibacter mesophilus TaxID=379069 RepID=UPI001F5D538D|nr:T9SS type A sorting domain-containing protein [Galbibacter mesophilus]MCM5664455.1 T9SS type A sorting domain-containing protein [Galbibacter mesophilus]
MKKILFLFFLMIPILICAQKSRLIFELDYFKGGTNGFAHEVGVINESDGITFFSIPSNPNSSGSIKIDEVYNEPWTKVLGRTYSGSSSIIITDNTLDLTNCSEFYNYSPWPFPDYYVLRKVIQYNIPSLLSINPGSNIVKSCENKFLKVFENNCYERNYSVHYKVGNGNIKPLLPYGNNGAEIVLQYSDFEGASKDLNLQLIFSHNAVFDLNSNNNEIITLTFKDCSPSLDQNVSPNPAPIDLSCNESDDGSFKVTFERELEIAKNEKMRLEIQRDIGSGYETFSSFVLYNKDFDNRSFTWPKELPKGTYRVRWQTKDGGDEFDSLPDAFTNSEPFFVNAPPELLLTLTKTDVQCYQGIDGSITVSASGGTPPYEYSIDYANWQKGTTFNDLSSGTYTITVRDGNGCTAVSAIELFELSTSVPEVIFGTVNDPSSNGGSDGSIEISVNGGSPPYSYQWVKVNDASFTRNTANIGSLSKGTYRVTVTDQNGCSVSPYTDEFILEDPPALTVSLSIIPENISCHGGLVNITATAQGGVSFVNGAKYIYNWSTGDSEATILNQPAGTYTVTVEDRNGNTVIESITVDEPEPLEVSSYDKTNIMCYGKDDGVISLQIDGGTKPYATVTWSKQFDSSFSRSGQTLSGLTAGIYYYEIIDANGCSLDNFGDGIEITEPFSPLSIVETNHQDNNIFGGSIGSITVVAKGGTKDYTYQWYDNEGNEMPGETNATINNLPAGFYSVTVTDKNGCEAKLNSLEITQLAKLEITDSAIDTVKCFDGNDGAITISVTGGKSPYTYQWEKEDDTSFTAPNSQTLENLSAGEYTVTVTDDSGSTAKAVQTIPVSQPQPLQIESAVEKNLCFSGNKGSIDITVSGGVAPYTFSWSNGETSEDISALTSGDYTVTVTDKYECTLEEKIYVGQPDGALAMTVDIEKHITGFGYNDGAIEVTVTGGTPNYSYEWFSDNGFTSTEEDINNLAPGNYTLVVTDDSGGDCVIDKEFTIIEPDKLLVNLEETFSVLCKDGTDAELQANVSGGVKSYKFQWFNIFEGTKNEIASAEAFLTELPAGDYQVEITDGNGVKTTSEVHTINEPERLVISEENIQHVLCHGEATGAIDISISGGTQPYSIYWSNDATSEDVQNLTAGNYNVAVKDDNGCWVETTFEIKNVFEPLSITNVELTNVSKFRGSDGEITVEIIGGEKPYNLNWVRLEDGQNMGSSTTIANIIKGNYQLTVSDANGCSLTEQYKITQPDIVDVTIVNPTCFEGCDGGLSVLVNKGEGNFTYSWSNGSTAADLTNLCAGSYTVSIEGFENETLVRTYVVENPEPLVIDLGDDLTTLCNDQERTLNATIDDSRASYLWTSNNGFSSSNPVITVSEAGLYTVTVTDNKGCQGTDTIEIKESPNDIAAEFFVSSQVFVNERFTVIDVTNPLPDSIEWILPEEGIVVSHDQDQAELYFDAPGEYEIVIKTTVGDCEAYQAKKVLVIDNHESIDDEVDVKDRESSFEEFLVYPNPTGGQFDVSLKLKKKGNVSVRIFNLSNNSVVAHQTGNGKSKYVLSFNISQYPAGMYAIVLETPGGNSVRKLIKG